MLLLLKYVCIFLKIILKQLQMFDLTVKRHTHWIHTLLVFIGMQM